MTALVPSRSATGGSVLGAEVARFDALAAQWWDPRGPMRPLHAMNPARIAWIHARLQRQGLAGGAVLDLGCGAGLAAEALAQRGYDVLGIDAAAGPIAAAIAHAPPGLALRYRQATAEALCAEGATFSAITALEVIEHVAEPAAFVQSLSDLLRPGGMLIVSTLNRTARAWATAKLGAEYIARLLPVGTHAYRQFVTPAELGAACRKAGLTLTELSGMRPNLAGIWGPVGDLGVNYIGSAVK